MIDPDDRDMLAAEYVLGTLDASEREAVATRLAGDADLADAVRGWEDRLSPLVGAVPNVDPPVGAYADIAVRLFGRADRGEGDGRDASLTALRRNLRRWQAATAGFASLAAVSGLWIAVREGLPSPEPQRYQAVLQRDAGAPAMLVDVDLAARRLAIRPFAAAAPAGRTYELWIIDPSLGAPRSLGVVPQGFGARDSLRSFDPSAIVNATYAVTLEAPGGSSTGLPTSAPVLSGRLTPTPP